MKCELFEELIPLYVGGDLEPPEADDLRQHLNSCAHCHRLTEDFQASQNWLTGFAVPKFDEASFAKLRASVLSQIEKQEKRGSWVEWLLPKWSIRQRWSPGLIMASAAITLAVITGLTVIVYRHQTAPVRIVGEIMADNGNQVRTGNDDQQPDIKSASNKVNPSAGNERRNLRSKRGASTLLPTEAFNNGGFEQPLEPPVIIEPAAHEEVAPTLPQEKEMLRIELQTADPNIRIIWLTPKEPGSPTKKPSA